MWGGANFTKIEWGGGEGKFHKKSGGGGGGGKLDLWGTQARSQDLFGVGAYSGEGYAYFCHSHRFSIAINSSRNMHWPICQKNCVPIHPAFSFLKLIGCVLAFGRVNEAWGGCGSKKNWIISSLNCAIWCVLKVLFVCFRP